MSNTAKVKPTGADAAAGSTPLKGFKTEDPLMAKTSSVWHYGQGQSVDTLSVILIEDASAGNVKGVRALLSEGVDVTAKDDEGRSALHHAALEGHFEIVDMLLKHRRDLKFVNQTDFFANTPLLSACVKPDGATADIVKDLLSVGANAGYQKASNGMTCLHWAAHHGMADVVQVLLRAPGVKVTVRNKDNLFPLDVAGLQFISNVLSLTNRTLLFGAGGTLQEGYSRYSKVMHSLLDAGMDGFRLTDKVKRNVKYVQTTLCWAAVVNHEGAAKAALAAGATVEWQSEAMQGRTCVHAAAEYGNDALLRVILERPDARASMHKASGGVVNIDDVNGDTPLHLAAKRASSRGLPQELCATPSTIRLLLEKGADDALVNYSGWAPCDYAHGSVDQVFAGTPYYEQSLMTYRTAGATCDWVLRVSTRGGGSHVSKLQKTLEGAGLATDVIDGLAARNKNVSLLLVRVTNEAMEEWAEKLQYNAKLLDIVGSRPYVRAEKDRFEPFKSRQRREIVELAMATLFDIPDYVSSGVLESITPTHEADELENIMQMWTHGPRYPRGHLKAYFLEDEAADFRELTAVVDYFGEKVGLYFGWLSFYTAYLLVAAVVGVVVFMFQLALLPTQGLDAVDHPVAAGYCVFLVSWGTVCSERWKRKQAELDYSWDVTHFEDEEKVRMEFNGDEGISPVTGLVEKQYPTAQRRRKSCASLLVLVVMLAMVIAAFIGLQIYKAVFQDTKLSLVHLGIAGMGNGLQIMVMNVVYKRVAVSLTHWENHRTSSDFHNSLVLKTFLFQFVNSYISILYSMFWERDMALLFVQVGGIMIAKQSADYAKEVWLPQLVVNRRMKPFLKAWWERFTKGKSPLGPAAQANRAARLAMLETVNAGQSAADGKMANVARTDTDGSSPKSKGAPTPTFEVTASKDQDLDLLLEEVENAASSDAAGGAAASEERPASLAGASGARGNGGGEGETKAAPDVDSKAAASGADAGFVGVSVFSGPAATSPTGAPNPGSVTPSRVMAKTNSRGRLTTAAEITPDGCVTSKTKGPDRYLRPGPGTDDSLRAEATTLLQEWDGLLDDYAEMVLQYGYCVMFAAAFPLAPLVAYVNNVFEIRAEITTMCTVQQRPSPERASTIGAWMSIIEVLSIIGIMTNCAILFFDSKQVDKLLGGLTTDGLSEYEKFAILVFIEHVLLCLKVSLSHFISDTPAWVEHRLARQRHLMKENNRIGEELAKEGVQRRKSLAMAAGNELRRRSVEAGAARKAAAIGSLADKAAVAVPRVVDANPSSRGPQHPRDTDRSRDMRDTARGSASSSMRSSRSSRRKPSIDARDRDRDRDRGRDGHGYGYKSGTQSTRNPRDAFKAAARSNVAASSMYHTSKERRSRRSRRRHSSSSGSSSGSDSYRGRRRRRGGSRRR